MSLGSILSWPDGGNGYFDIRQRSGAERAVGDHTLEAKGAVLQEEYFDLATVRPEELKLRHAKRCVI